MIDCHWPFPNEKQTKIRLIDLIIEGNLWNQLPATMKNHDLSFTCYHIEILSASQTEKKMCNKILLAWTDIFNSTRDCLFSLNFIAVFMILIHIYHAKCIVWYKAECGLHEQSDFVFIQFFSFESHNMVQ